MHRRSDRWSVSLAGLALLAAAVGCSGDGGPAAPRPADASQALQREPAQQQQPQQPPPAAPSLTVLAERGSGQSLAPGETLRELLVVQVLDSAGHGVAGVPVQWSTPSGGGSVFIYEHARATGVDGRAVARWTLGPEAGEQRVTASAAGQTVAFTARAVPGASPPVVAIGFGLGDTWLEPAETSYVRAAALDAAGLVVKAATFTWSVDVPGIVTIREVAVAPGVSRLEFTAVAPGDVHLTARAGGQTKTILVRVFAPGTRPSGGMGCGGCG